LKRAFTLFELMVSIAIFLIMIALVMPLSRIIQRQGFQVVATSNLRQIGIAWQLYRDDSDNGFPPLGTQTLANQGQVDRRILLAPGDPFPNGYAKSINSCRNHAEKFTIDNSFEDPFQGIWQQDLKFIERLERADPNTGIVALRVLGTKTGTQTIECNGAELTYFSGKIIRLRLDNSIKVGQFRPIVQQEPFHRTYWLVGRIFTEKWTEKS
jgi:prepilin-type N-terminal cleavage/methylation domain-containing protein